MTATSTKSRGPANGRRKATALSESAEARTPSGRYPAHVWVKTHSAKTFALTEAPPADVPRATGIFPRPVWDNPVSSTSTASVPDPSLRLKEQDYTDEIGSAPDEETVERQAVGPLDNREIYRIVRAVATAHSGTDLYSAVMPQESFGLCFGIVLFSQASGHLGKVLQLMQRRDDTSFRQTFGASSDELLTVTNAATREAHLAPVGGDDLSSAAWIQRFKNAGAVAAFQAAQNEQAIEGLFRPILRVAGELGINTDRSLALVYDRVITRGVGGALRWLIHAVGPLRTSEQRISALAAVGFDDLKDFQSSTGWVPATGIFGPETHAALVGALRRADATLLPTPCDYISRMVEAAEGPAKKRLAQLRDSDQFEDAVYALGDQ